MGTEERIPIPLMDYILNVVSVNFFFNLFRLVMGMLGSIPSYNVKLSQCELCLLLRLLCLNISFSYFNSTKGKYYTSYLTVNLVMIRATLKIKILYYRI